MLKFYGKKKMGEDQPREVLEKRSTQIVVNFNMSVGGGKVESMGSFP